MQNTYYYVAGELIFLYYESTSFVKSFLTTSASRMISFIHPSIYNNRGCPLFILGVAGFRRSVALQFLHQQFAAATQNVPELPQGAAAHEGSTAVLQTQTHTHKIINLSNQHWTCAEHNWKTFLNICRFRLPFCISCYEWLAAAWSLSLTWDRVSVCIISLERILIRKFSNNVSVQW